MSKNYEVSAPFINFGIGIVLKLSEGQADIRSQSLSRKKSDLFEVIAPVQFKKGEKISANPAQLTKSMLERLSEISDKKPDGNINKIEAPTEYPCIQHTGFGKYNVFDADKNLLNPKPIKKDEAEKIFTQLSQKNNSDNDANEDEKSPEKKQSDNGANNSS
ncbi:MAG: hypothetical protein KGP29_07080 [Proteobacteria bacterium]|nr:hypothetical protein [Pseudomonadota bacterium]